MKRIKLAPGQCILHGECIIGDYRSSWLIGGLALNADPMEVKLESWEVGQMNGGN